eukprot:1317370-Amorphochlora_amoeboformis.AAC.1
MEGGGNGGGGSIGGSRIGGEGGGGGGGGGGLRELKRGYEADGGGVLGRGRGCRPTCVVSESLRDKINVRTLSTVPIAIKPPHAQLVVVDRSVAVALARAVGVVDVFFAVAGAVAAAHAFYFLLLSENLPQLWKHYK